MTRDLWRSAPVPGLFSSVQTCARHPAFRSIPDCDHNSDGAHPNDQGYAYMAGIWYAAIKRTRTYNGAYCCGTVVLEWEMPSPAAIILG